MPSPSRPAPSTRFWWYRRRGALAPGRGLPRTAAWSSSLSLRSVAYVILIRSAIGDPLVRVGRRMGADAAVAEDPRARLARRPDAAWCDSGGLQSSAATTSANEGATASGMARDRRSRRPSPVPRAGRTRAAGRRRARRRGLAGEHQHAAHAQPPGAARCPGQDRRPTIATSRAGDAGRPRSAATPASAVRNMIGPGLPHSTAGDAGRELERGDEGAAVERRAAWREPPRVPVHRQQGGAAADEPEGAVDVRVAQVLVAVPDDHGGGPGARRVGLLVRTSGAARRTRGGRPAS